MGKQITFYMTREDESQFVSFLRTTPKVVVFCARQEHAGIVPLESLPSESVPFWFAMCLWNSDISRPPVLHFIPAQSHYMVDELESDVVQFDRCVVDARRIGRGRLWMEMNGYSSTDPATVFRKSAAFDQWFRQLANWIKRHSTRNGAGEYLMQGAVRFRAQGGACGATELLH